MQRMGMSMMTGGDAPTLNLDRETVSNMDSLLRVFGGRQQRSVRTPYREQQRLGGGQRLARRLIFSSGHRIWRRWRTTGASRGAGGGRSGWRGWRTASLSRAPSGARP